MHTRPRFIYAAVTVYPASGRVNEIYAPFKFSRENVMLLHVNRAYRCPWIVVSIEIDVVSDYALEIGNREMKIRIQLIQ